MEEEITERVGGFSERIEYDDEDEYLPFILSEDVDNDPAGKVAFVSFKVQTGEENRSTQRSSTSNEAAGYQIRKNKKKSVYHEDYSYANEAKKPKEKPKNIPTLQAKKSKTVTKPTPALPPSHDFLDIVLSAAIKAQASQTQNVEVNLGPKSPRNNNTQNNDFRTSGKFSAPRIVEDKPPSVVKKQKVSVKKTESNKSFNQAPDEFYQRHLEYKEHYIKEAVIKDDIITLKHTKVPPVSMKYAKKKFVFREKDIVDSKLFSMAMGTKGESEMEEEEENDQVDEDWLKKLKLKESVLALHFKGVLKDYKPSILV